MEDLQKGFVDIGLALEAVLNLVNIIYGVVELYRLVVLHWWAGGGPTDWWVELHWWRARRGVGGDGRIALAARCQGLGLKRLQQGRILEILGHKILYFI